ncbi:asparagine synthase (glutamine-hydrolyzing) [Candidatus Pelagibacter bacterium]|nr:asparagine synthase (glutamine-hydrolyzing) [Candidatus Pelagibacter bacterium]
MCGIAGYIGTSTIKLTNLEQASQTLKHRGPDGIGFYTHKFQNNNISFVHRRLAIIDLDNRSNQPFSYQNTVLVFNGEIYNYIELRKNLEDLGHIFKTKGDTEVLIHALCQWGEDAIDKLEGMWAFAWYNEKNGSLLLSRDRFGEKPLYIWQKDKGVYFSSEIKGIAALAGKWPEVNKDYLLGSLVNGYRSLYKKKETFFLGVEEISSGNVAIINSKGFLSKKKYWKPRLVENKKLSFKDAVSITKEAIIKAVKLRIRSDVPIAFCMSGGVDSNTLISVASKKLNCDVHGFTIANEDSRYEEQSLVNIAVKELGVKHTQVPLSKKNFLKNMRALVKAHDAPVATISYYVHWLLMNEINANGYKISISGTAADELFSGYYDHHLLYLASISDDESLFKKSKKNWHKYVAPYVRNEYLQDPDRFLKNSKFRDHIYSGKDFNKYLRNPIVETFHEKEYPVSLLRKRMLNELFYETVPVILHEDDINAMHNSIENRSPFLDRNLFEISLQIPTEFLVNDGRAKSVLRESMRGILPDAILESPRKVGFNAPIEDLLDMKVPINREQLLDDCQIFNFVKKNEIEKILNMKKLPNSLSKFLFSFIGAKFFLEEFNR